MPPCGALGTFLLGWQMASRQTAPPSSSEHPLVCCYQRACTRLRIVAYTVEILGDMSRAAADIAADACDGLEDDLKRHPAYKGCMIHPLGQPSLTCFAGKPSSRPWQGLSMRSLGSCRHLLKHPAPMYPCRFAGGSRQEFHKV